MLDLGKGGFELTGLKDEQVIGRPVREVLGLEWIDKGDGGESADTDGDGITDPIETTLEWGVRSLGKRVAVHAEGDLPDGGGGRRLPRLRRRRRAAARPHPGVGAHGGIACRLSKLRASVSPPDREQPVVHPLRPRARRLLVGRSAIAHQADQARARPEGRHRADLPGGARRRRTRPSTARHRPRDRDHPPAHRHARRRRARDRADRRRPDPRRPARRRATPSARSSRSAHTAQLYFYDWEPNVIANPVNRDKPRPSGLPAALRRGQVRLEAEARVLREQSARPTAPPTTSSTADPGVVAGPDASRRRTCSRAARARSQPAEHARSSRYRRARSWSGGADQATRDQTSTIRTPARLLRDQATGRRSRAPTSRTRSSELDPRPTSRTSPSTSPTTAARRSRTSPRRSPSAACQNAPLGRDRQLAAADQFSGHFAVVLDQRGQVARRSSTSSRTRTGSTAAPAPRSPAASPSRRPRTWPRSCRSARCRSS